MTDPESLPLFVLPLAAVPGEEVPLHVFEPRYRALVAFCEETGSEFGVLFNDDEGVREVGCAVEIEAVTERHPDGRLDLVARGTRRFALAGEITEGAYPAAPVVWVHDDPVGPHDDVSDAAEDAIALFCDLADRITGVVPDVDPSDTPISFALAARVAFGGPAKQGLIELRSESRRLALLERLLRAALARIDQVDQQAAAARSNGRVHFD